MYTQLCSLLVMTLFSFGLSLPATGQESPLAGFTPERARQQRQLEQRFMALPNSSHAESLHATLTAAPHLAGSPADRRTAEYVLREFQSYGFEASIEQFDVLLSEPEEIKLDLLAPVKFSGPTPEWIDVRPSSQSSSLIGFSAYSGSGDVSAAVIFANRGLPFDYEYLRRIGISAEGKIAIVRRGDSESFRGVKAKVAEENKAAGLIIYSDPDDDGYHAGDPYPQGPWRPASSAQRGTLLYEFLYPGDPTTPDGPSTPGALRAELAHSKFLPRIPTLPLSYGDAKHILEAIGGPVAPRSWQGGLPITYHVGPGAARARLRIRMHNTVKPIWIVVARVIGTQQPDEIIVLGNHRDAWTYGGVDPGTGTVALLEAARSLGSLMHAGWHPRRSIWFCSWDAEEQGMIGSTEWAEKHAAELGDKAIAYLNLDVAAAGGGNRFNAAAVPSLKEFMREVAADVPDPLGGSVLERAKRDRDEQTRLDVSSGSPQADPSQQAAVSSQKITIDNIGSGTDYVAFLDHLGIASTDFGFGDEYGAYHATFDNHRYVKKFADPGFRYQVGAAQYYGLLLLRLCEADLLPFDYNSYALEIGEYLSNIETQLVALDARSQLDLRHTTEAARRLARVASAVQNKYIDLVSQGSATNLDAINNALAKGERQFLLPQGLPRRPWYRHVVFAPGIYSADAPEPLPGVQESLNRRDFDEARRQLEFLTRAINKVAEQLSAVPLP